MTDALAEFLRQWGELNASGIAALLVVFVVSGLVLVPRTFLCLAAGAIFGPMSIFVILPSTTLGSVTGFLLARYFFAERLHRAVDRRPRLRAVLEAVDGESWRIVGLMRFGSPVPTTVQNYLFGLTRIGLLPFTLATFVFTIPQICLYVYLGAAGKAALLEDSGSGLRQGLFAVGLLTLLAIMMLIMRKARAVLREAAGVSARISPHECCLRLAADRASRTLSEDHRGQAARADANG